MGCCALGGAYGVKDRTEFARMLARAVDLGVTFFDTAEGYGQEAESILGDALVTHRRQVVLSTKVGITAEGKRDLSPAHIRVACTESLKRLRTDWIDLYQVHFDDPGTPVLETISTLEELVQQGKIRRYGIGHLPPVRVQEYLERGRPFSMLMELSAVARAARTRYLPLLERHGIAGLAFSTTGRGLLTGTIHPGHTFPPGDLRNVDPLFQREQFASALRVMAHFQRLASHYGKTIVQAAIAWVLSQPTILCALCGPSTVSHLEENLGGSGWTLEQEDLQMLEELFRQEDETLDRERHSTITRILGQPLPTQDEQAFVDLVYAAETAVDLGMATEEQVMPLLLELIGLREKVDGSLLRTLELIQRQLGAMVEG
ncbi:MAG: aldo/keto reductase [Coprothermobacterota bacterium]|nr:aldo/keto reductase [Coprothermobacterota bacterium]